MDRMLYVAMSGANEYMQAQSALAHNLANASTTGYRADVVSFKSLPLHGTGQPTRVYPLTVTQGVDTSPGTVQTTGRSLDVAVKGQGWIAVQAPDGSEAYTRAGDMRLTETGQLVTGSGKPVMGNGGPIAIPQAEAIEIGSDGTISIRPVGQTPQALAVVDRIKLVNPDTSRMSKGPDGLMHMNDGTTAPADANVQLTSGALESSNVNPVDAMVSMLEMARQYEVQVKMMRTAQENDASSAKLMQVK
jgi:flagellar basal-body rod protein FlgF